jgi:hypothetical protein
MGSPQAHQANIDRTLTLQELQAQPQPEWRRKADVPLGMLRALYRYQADAG